MFYKVTVGGEALAIRLSPKNPENLFFPKWWVKGMDTANYVAIHSMIPSQTIGLFLGYGEIYRSDYKNSSKTTFVECVVLLIIDQRFYIPTGFVTQLFETELEEKRK